MLNFALFVQSQKILYCHYLLHILEQGVELGKLSVHHNLVKDYGGTVASTLLGVGTMEILKINLDIVFNGLTEHEEEVLQNVKEKYFKNLGKTAWDTGIWNLDEYNKMIKN